jgi:hypothetical protein
LRYVGLALLRSEPRSSASGKSEGASRSQSLLRGGWALQKVRSPGEEKERRKENARSVCVFHDLPRVSEFSAFTSTHASWTSKQLKELFKETSSFREQDLIYSPCSVIVYVSLIRKKRDYPQDFLSAFLSACISTHDDGGGHVKTPKQDLNPFMS